MNTTKNKVNNRVIAIPNWRALLAAGAAATTFCSAALAHHSRANFDLDTVIELQGTITEFSWRNPHTFATIAVATESGDSREYVLELNSIRVMTGRGWTRDTIKVGDETVTADKILIATGGRPQLWDTPGIEHAITSEEAFYLPDLPERVMIAGGGYIAVEFAGIFHGYGAEVTQLYRRDLFLRGIDIDVRRTLADEMQKKGIDIR